MGFHLLADSFWELAQVCFSPQSTLVSIASSYESDSLDHAADFAYAEAARIRTCYSGMIDTVRTGVRSSRLSIRDSSHIMKWASESKK